MLNYEIASGRLYRDDVYIGTGYSGFNEGKNNLAHVADKGIGPIPPGLYDLEKITHAGLHDPVFRLIPHPENVMYDRDGFLMHGDSIAAPGTASHGCIIMVLPVRLNVDHNGDKLLKAA